MFSGIGGFELGIKNAYERLLYDSEKGGRGQAGVVSERGGGDSSGEPDIGQYPTCIGYSEIKERENLIWDKDAQIIVAGI